MKTCILVAVMGLLPLVLLNPIESNKSPLNAAQESLEAHVFGSELNNEGSTRDKRTIGPLRQIFPNLSQLVDSKIQMITRVLFRVIGRLVLRGGLGGGVGGGGGGGGGNSAASSNGSAAGGSNSRRISITLPTYPPGEDDDEDEDEDETAEEINTVTTTEGDSKNQLEGAESRLSEVRVPYEEVEAEAEAEADEDQETAAAENVDQQVEAEDAATDDEDATADEQRDKRFLNFNLGGGGAGGAAGGSGGGSGNFLFDIIRLVAGSGNTESSDERANSAVGVANEQTVEKDDGYQAGVPGPITRLFIIANRGISNLMQDLILRLAQTSERIVNFKARLITSII